MSEIGIKQRLAAILAADAAGYSHLLAALDAARKVFRARIEFNHFA